MRDFEKIMRYPVNLIPSVEGGFVVSFPDIPEALTQGNTRHDALQAALRLADQLGQAYRLCDGTAWDTEVLNVTWGNGVLYDADKEWADRLAMVQQGMLRPELALAWKFDLPCDTEEDLAAIRQKYMPTMQDMES